MKLRWAVALIAMPLLAALGIWTSTGLTQEPPRAPTARIPEFPMRALASPHATKVNLFVSRDGTLTRYAVHVDREAIPDWVHAMADEAIGKGEDVGYEVELYPDGSEVFEVYRQVQGREKQFSVHLDRSVKYVGAQLDEKELPVRVQSVLKGVPNLTVQKCVFKEGPAFAEYHLRGMIDGRPHRIRIGRDGKLLSVQRQIDGEVEVTVQ